MKKILLLGAACLPLLAAAPAHAADSYYNTDVARDGSFNGPYLGATANYNWTNGEATRTGVGTNDDIGINGAEGAFWSVTAGSSIHRSCAQSGRVIPRLNSTMTGAAAIMITHSVHISTKMKA